MKKSALGIFENAICEIEKEGLLKKEKIITSPQGAFVETVDGGRLINLCSNNYLGLSNNLEVIEAAKRSYEKQGYGMSSVRFICGTQNIHKELEEKISRFLETEDTILYSSCFDANGGLFEALLTDVDAVISDELNHASIIDGIRLCKAKRFRYKNNDMNDLAEKLNEASDCRIKMIVTDGVFSMDGVIANLKEICLLAEKYDALVVVDESHSVGFMGKTGRGTQEHCGVEGKVDIYTGTFGKALGGASGGYTSGKKEIIDLLRQRSRPYLFSNTLAPAITAATIKVFEIISRSTSLRDKLLENTNYFGHLLSKIGFDIISSGSPIIPIMLYDERKAVEVARRMYDKGVYVTAFSYPVVPKGKARIRTQMSATFEKKEIDFIVEKFSEVKKETNL